MEDAEWVNRLHHWPDIRFLVPKPIIAGLAGLSSMLRNQRFWQILLLWRLRCGRVGPPSLESIILSSEPDWKDLTDGFSPPLPSVHARLL